MSSTLMYISRPSIQYDVFNILYFHPVKAIHPDVPMSKFSSTFHHIKVDAIFNEDKMKLKNNNQISLVNILLHFED